MNGDLTFFSFPFWNVGVIFTPMYCQVLRFWKGKNLGNFKTWHDAFSAESSERKASTLHLDDVLQRRFSYQSQSNLLHYQARCKSYRSRSPGRKNNGNFYRRWGWSEWASQDSGPSKTSQQRSDSNATSKTCRKRAGHGCVCSRNRSRKHQGSCTNHSGSSFFVLSKGKVDVSLQHPEFQKWGTVRTKPRPTSHAGSHAVSTSSVRSHAATARDLVRIDAPRLCPVCGSELFTFDMEVWYCELCFYSDSDSDWEESESEDNNELESEDDSEKKPLWYGPDCLPP
ncbi:hypothetical protein K440DRAFT_370727 [Wilcoxina mikolae CBS 423.85]|nr:hypothetical protein K440DRAFT_370727 [Wilcoxina mikolae CBS 423.85]